MSQGTITFTDSLDDTLGNILGSGHYDRVFVLTDTTVGAIYGSRLRAIPALAGAPVVTIPEGDEHKDIESLTRVWQFLSDSGATRHSCLVNIGGGMVTDLGGFAASTFKRGISYVNVPTTLLAMVDASSGGKTGINLGGIKNEVGVFSQSQAVVIHTPFLATLTPQNILSGYAEMLKHSLIRDDALWADTITADPSDVTRPGFADMLRRSITVKSDIVRRDPREQHLRKILNLGHTFGHAFETYSHARGAGILHGYAVAYGLVCELYLSCVKHHFPTGKMRQTVRFIRDNYGTYSFTCNDYDALLSLMRHDKKNCGTTINFALLSDVGVPQIDSHATKDDIFEAFDFLREGL